MTPREKYGTEFFCQPFTITKTDGTKSTCHDIGVCIKPKKDKASTLAFGWDVFRELASWVSEAVETAPEEESFRIVIAWSQSVRRLQGHIFKIWSDRDQIKLAAECASYQEYAIRFGGHRTPMPNWEKDVFERGA